jgi:hypothetical protein
MIESELGRFDIGSAGRLAGAGSRSSAPRNAHTGHDSLSPVNRVPQLGQARLSVVFTAPIGLPNQSNAWFEPGRHPPPPTVVQGLLVAPTANFYILVRCLGILELLKIVAPEPQLPAAKYWLRPRFRNWKLRLRFRIRAPSPICHLSPAICHYDEVVSVLRRQLG